MNIDGHEKTTFAEVIFSNEMSKKKFGNEKSLRILRI